MGCSSVTSIVGLGRPLQFTPNREFDILTYTFSTLLYLPLWVSTSSPTSISLISFKPCLVMIGWFGWKQALPIPNGLPKFAMAGVFGMKSFLVIKLYNSSIFFSYSLNCPLLIISKNLPQVTLICLFLLNLSYIRLSASK